MDKSSKTSASKVEVAVVDAKPLKKGNRKAEEAAEQVPGKKQKKNEAALKQAIDKKQAEAKTTKKSKKVESRSEDDSSSESEKEVKEPKSEVPVKKVPAGNVAKNGSVAAKKKDESSDEKDPKTSTPQGEATESRFLFMGNLSSSIEQSDVLNFFKNVGEVLDIFFTENRETRPFEGCGLVEFATVEAAKNALKLAGKDLLSRPVTLEMAPKRVAFIPGSRFKKTWVKRMKNPLLEERYNIAGIVIEGKTNQDYLAEARKTSAANQMPKDPATGSNDSPNGETPPVDQSNNATSNPLTVDQSNNVTSNPDGQKTGNAP